MSGRVDVLAAMDTAAAAIEGCWAIYEGPKDLIAARAAVAELIAAANEVRVNFSDFASPEWAALEDAMVRVGALDDQEAA